jgi:ABC-type sugar transport system permease subunit
MDPLTLFALANGAVQAVKKGCQLYKDIKGAAGDVKAVIKDLDEQFHGAYEAKGKTPTVEQRNQFVQEKNRVIELNKRDGETTGIYTELGEHLGAYYDNYYKCMAIFEEEEKHSQHEIYQGDASLGKRALQRVLMRKQLEQMGTELREIMVYQSPPELGALHTEVEEMMKVMGKQQKILVAKQMKEDHIRAVRRRRHMDAVWANAVWGIAAIVIAAAIGILFALVIQDRIEKYPQLGTGIIPKTEKQRREEAEPKRYSGR